MKETYIMALVGSHNVVKNSGMPPSSKEDRYKVAQWVEKLLYPTGLRDSEIIQIRESYIARGISALDHTESKPL